MTDKKITVLAVLRARADRIEQVKKVLESLIGPTRQEAGCISYDLHQGYEDKEHFMFYENWSSHDAWDKHMETDHLKNFHTQAPELLAEAPVVTVWEMV